MAIPAEPPVHVETALVSEPCDDILYSASQNVAIMWETSSEGRSIIECVPASKRKKTDQSVISHNPTKDMTIKLHYFLSLGPVFGLFQALLEAVLFRPKLENALLF